MSAVILDESFSRPVLDPRLQWFHPPPSWRVDPERRALLVEPLARTDFWQRTHYGFQADNGHFLGLEVTGDLNLSTCVAVFPVHQYDQAGLMIRASADCWVKTSVEHELAGPAQLGVVITDEGFSDWSMQDFAQDPMEIQLRLRLGRGDLTAEFSLPDQGQWKTLRVAHWPMKASGPLWCGLYACSPKGAGFRAEFKWLRIEKE
jgi:regulation of enolase protein 1 (concanavalin A-like superfamily)